MMNDDDTIRALLSLINSHFAQAAGTVIIPPKMRARIIEYLTRIEMDLHAVIDS